MCFFLCLFVESFTLFAFRSPSTRATVKKAQGVTAAPSGASPFPGVYANGQGQALPVPYAPSSLAPDRKSFKSRVVLGWTCRTKQGMGYSIYFIGAVFKRRPVGPGLWLARSTRQLAATPDPGPGWKKGGTSCRPYNVIPLLPFPRPARRPRFFPVCTPVPRSPLLALRRSSSLPCPYRL